MGINPGVLKNVSYNLLYDKISLFRETCPTHILAVDGGVTIDNIQKLAHLGVTNLTCGSKTLYNDTPLVSNIQTIKNKFI